MKTFAVSDSTDNPHACILSEVTPCLACALIAALGEERRSEALGAASAVAGLEVHTHE